MPIFHFAKLVIHDVLYLVIQIYSHILRFLFTGYNRYCKPRLVAPSIPAGKSHVLPQSAVVLAKKIRDKEVSCVSLVSDCIARAKEINPQFNAIAEDRYNAALQTAKSVDQALQDGSALPVEAAPLLGVPCTIKECIFVKGMQCTGGLTVRKARRADTNAQVVDRIMDAGAIPIATTVTSEMCASFECNNPVYGRARNPYDSRRTPGGSSGGEACAIASCCVPFGIGSDGGGSIRMPANFCGIFGHKPTQGTVPSDDQCLPLCGPQLELHTFGPMARHAEDLRTVLKIIMNPKDALVCMLDRKVDLKDLKVFFVDEIVSHFVTGIEYEVKKTMYHVVNYLEETADVPCIRINPKLLDQSFLLWMNQMGHEGSPSVSHALSDGQSAFISPIQVARLPTGKSDHTPQAVLFAIFEKAANIAGALGILSSQQRQKGRDDLERLRRQINALLSIENSVLLFPSHPTLAPFHNQSLIHPADHAYAAIFNALGLPVTQVPVRLTPDGVPVGIQVVAGKHNDFLTLSVAEMFESAFGGWKEPLQTVPSNN